MSDLDLTALRHTANSEPSHKWGKWTAEEDDWDGFVVFADDGQPGQTIVAKGIHQGSDEGEATADFMVTFDPPTVLALLDRLEAAEVWTVAHPCEVTHEPPYDFKSCAAHDRTFPLDGECDHAGKSYVEWMEARETAQRFRAIQAEDALEAAEATIQRVRDLHTEVIVYEYDGTKEVFVYDDGEQVVMARLCGMCTSNTVIEAIGDCGYDSGSTFDDVNYPCPTTRALDGE